MRAMSRIRFCRFLAASAAAAMTTAASAQSFYHAPPAAAQNARLLPIIRPAIPALEKPPIQRQPDPSTSPVAESTAPDVEAVPQVPAHLSLNQWKKLPAGRSIPASQPSDESVVAKTLPPVPPASTSEIEATPGPDHLRAVASRSLARGDIAAAEIQLASALERYPSDLRLAISLARVRETRGDWAGASEAFDTVIRLDAAEARWKTRRAECHYFNGDYANAVVDYFDAEAASAPLTAAEYIRFGDAALRTDRLDVADKAFGAVSRLAKDPLPQVELLRGLVALKRGNAGEARTILLRANAVWPNDPQLTHALRVASAARHKAKGQIARVHANEGLHEAVAAAPSVETRDAEHAPVVSGWRPSRAMANGRVQPASGELDETSIKEIIAPAVDVEDGWRAASSTSRPSATLQPDDGAVLSAPGEVDPSAQRP